MFSNPPLFPEAFANAGAANTIPTAPTGTNLASLDEGFPAITSLPPSSGGLPPERADFNGILKQVTQHLKFLGEGGVYLVDGTVSAAGYSEGAVVLLANGLLYQNLQDGNTNDPNTNKVGWSPVNQFERMNRFWAGWITGTANAYIALLNLYNLGNPAGEFPQFILFQVEPGATTLNNTGASTIKFGFEVGVGYTATKELRTNDGQPLVGGEIQAGNSYLAMLDGTGTYYSLMNPSVSQAVKAGGVAYTTSGSTTDLMVGQGVSIIPRSSKIRIIYSTVPPSTGAGGTVRIRQGNGAAPAAGSAVSGSVFDTIAIRAGSGSNYCMMQVISVTPGVEVWLEASFQAASTSAASCGIFVSVEDAG